MIDVLDRLKITKQQLEDFCQRHHIVRLSFFGSVVRDDFRPDSDVDVLVKFDPQAKLSGFDIVHIIDALKVLFGRSVDLVEEGATENPFRLKSISRDQQVVYAA